MLNPVTTWLLGLMTILAPPSAATTLPHHPGWTETAPERQARYEAIAGDLYAVTYDAAEPPGFAGPQGRARTAALMLAIAYKESGFAKDVDVGPCYHGPGREGRCDGGHSACMMQVNIHDGRTPEGWSQDDLFADRRKCFRTALRILRISLHECQAPDAGVNMYASGNCTEGQEKGAARLRLARKLLGLRQDAPSIDTPFILVPTS